MIVTILVLAAVVASIGSLKFISVPYVWISMFWFLVSMFAMKLSVKSSTKAVWFNGGIVILTLGIFEAYLWFTRPPQTHFEVVSVRGAKSLSQRHPFLGVAPRTGEFIERKYYGNQLVYEASYTIDSQGLRLSPPYVESESLTCVLFFGGSYIFGFGLNDTETLPYQVGLKTNGRHRIYNFAYPRYGPHQMLSALEHNLVTDLAQCQAVHGIYGAIIDHIPRVAGFYSWTRY